jgi:CRISPR-associated endonuclease/helicase Cas3
MPPYAHTDPKHPNSDDAPNFWEPLFTLECAALKGGHCQACESLARDHGHLNKVAWWTARFAEDMFPPGAEKAKTARQWGWHAGLWHDFGKFAPEWQVYLMSKAADAHTDEVNGKMDHATAGAVFAQDDKRFGDLLSYMIAGHHSGLADAPELFEGRLKKTIPDWRGHAQSSGLLEAPNLPTPPLTRPDAGSGGLAFMLRFFYSCLVDADFMATEAFMQSEQSLKRKLWAGDILERLLISLEKHLTNEFGGAREKVNQVRDEVRVACARAAESPSGFFSLTVPTGGGKTLSSLLFALRHARKHGLRRIIYVIPFTSIIKQNADVFRNVFVELSRELGREIVLEHHSKFDPAKETTETRLNAENWDAPLIVTTNVQFFESLYANRSRGCRKLHRIARSVIIFDEVQALPLDLLSPILHGLHCIVKDFQCSAVLCTATQPALQKRTDFTIGIPAGDVKEIVPDRESLFSALRRTESHDIGPISDDALMDHVRSKAGKGCLIIVNTTKAAQILHAKMRETTTARHLSARMCPAHVIAVLNEVKALRESEKTVVLVSTQIIEAGVDISFPMVYRAECGLDSFAQAAGRCNRNGELQDESGQPILGKVFLFDPIDHPIPKGLLDLRTAAAVTRSHILPVFDASDFLSLDAIQKYFELAIWQAGPKTDQWDKNHIVSGDMPCFPPIGKFRAFLFKTAAERFKLIPSITKSVLIPWEAEGRALAEELRHLSKIGHPPSRQHFRKAQQYTVQVYENEWQHMQNRVEVLCDGAFPVLIHPENNYDPQTGLNRPDAPDDPAAFYL